MSPSTNQPRKLSRSKWEFRRLRNAVGPAATSRIVPWSLMILLALGAWPEAWASFGTGPARPTTSLQSRQAASKKSDTPLAQRATEPWVEVALSPVEVGVQILERNNLHGGIAVALGCTPAPKTSPYPNAGQGIAESLREVFGSVGSTEVRYRGDMVNVTPRGGIPSLLLTRVHQFDYVDGKLISPSPALMPEQIAVLSSRAELTPKMAILSLPELRASARSAGFGAAAPSGFGAISTNVHLTIHARDVTLVDLLDRIVTLAGRGVWTYEQRDCSAHRTYRLDLVGI